MPPEAACTIKLPVFEGPFDLLFHLVKKAELDIWSISIASITEQYLAYLQSMQELNLDIASEFLVMAATLLRLKSKMLLPRPPREGDVGAAGAEDEEEDLFQINSPEELFERLVEYRRFKEAAGYLAGLAEEQQKIFLRSTGGEKMVILPGAEKEQQSYYTYWEGAHLLGEIMNRFEAVAAARAVTPVIDLLDDLPVSDQSAHICALLEHNSGRPLPLKSFLRQRGLWELLVTFISLLELARLRRVVLLQERPFGPILVKPAKGESHGT